MNKVFNNEYNEKLNNRDLLQNKFDLSFANSDFEALRNLYKSLRNMEFDMPLDLPCESISISSLAENLSIACDIICNDCNTSFIYCGNETSFVKANSKLLTKVMLNLLSNAFLYSSSELITIKTIEKKDYISLEIQNAGSLFDTFAFGKGLSFVTAVCEKYDCKFFIEASLLSVKQILLIPKATNYKNIVNIPDFCELLSDRLSPVYVEFFGVEN